MEIMHKVSELGAELAAPVHSVRLLSRSRQELFTRSMWAKAPDPYLEIQLDQMGETLNWWRLMELYCFLQVEAKAERGREPLIQFQLVAGECCQVAQAVRPTRKPW